MSPFPGLSGASLRSRLRRHALTSAAIVLLAAALGASLSAATGHAQEATTVPVRFGILSPSASTVYFFLGAEKGIYKKHGIDLQPIVFQKGGPEVIAAAASGQLDIGTLGTPILVGISRGIPIKVVGSPAVKGQEFVLVGQNEVKSVEDLKGKQIGVSSVGGGQSQALRFILTAKKLEAADVQEIAYGSGGNGYVAFKSGQIAAAVLQEPNITKLVNDGDGHILAKAADYYGRYQHSYVFASDKFIAASPETIRKFFEASREAIQYAKDNRAELVSYSKKLLNLDEKLLNKIYDEQIPGWDETQAVDTEGLLNAIKIVQQVGDISKDYTPDIDKIVDPRFTRPAS
ncbi:ABC transporter substrate-binding protein [Ancylobacter sonchi]|uniref:ABC transporter substrate-binding protein n=1 Tax=Ancylobacter sonchi TaxID=1937790 RepID=UPI001BD60551|nr:ABC transporter substrate-binding protein [Ancylobacter sonchi]MBS7535194.1 ABC transporter substrate-binding protein [Ancylobacter sonchi]